ncbi:MAG: RidA family protein, partial [Rhodospirillales bacterium]|nr:RidA family protein [Rhodospirillales bacterium]
MQELTRFFEVYPDRPGATVPLGVCVDDVVYANGLAGIDVVTGVPADGLEAQTRLALNHLQTLVEGAGGSIDNIGRAVAYVTKVEDRDAVYGPWDAMFPDPQDRPAFKVLVGSLPHGQLVNIDGLAVLGERRKRTDIDGVPARDPTVVLGDWLFTSRVHGIRPNEGVPEDPEAEARQNLENLATLLNLNGFSPADLSQITLFVRDDENFERAQRAYEQVFPDGRTRPPAHRLNSFITARFRYSIEMIAKRGGDAPQ